MDKCEFIRTGFKLDNLFKMAKAVSLDLFSVHNKGMIWIGSAGENYNRAIGGAVLRRRGRKYHIADNIVVVGQGYEEIIKLVHSLRWIGRCGRIAINAELKPRIFIESNSLPEKLIGLVPSHEFAACAA